MASPVLTTTPGDQHAYWHVHANRRRPHASWGTASTGLKSLKSDQLTTVDGICRHVREFYHISDRRRSLRPIPIR